MAVLDTAIQQTDAADLDGRITSGHDGVGRAERSRTSRAMGLHPRTSWPCSTRPSSQWVANAVSQFSGTRDANTEPVVAVRLVVDGRLRGHDGVGREAHKFEGDLNGDVGLIACG